MFIKELKLVNYRSYSGLRLEPGRYVNVLTGNNAEGKTNVVEAIFMCALMRSHRTRNDSELVKSGEENAYVKLTVETRLGERTLEIGIPQKGKKRMLVDSKPVKRLAEVMSTVNAVMFAPEDLQIVKGAPDVRRRFMDMEMSQLSAAYFAQLQAYNKSLKHRNAVLKSMGGTGGLMVHILPEHWEQLKIWDEQVLDNGAKIMKERAEFVKRLNIEANRIHSLIAGEGEKLSVIYASNIKGARDTEVSFRKGFRDALRRTMGEEFRNRATFAGPHKDELDILINGKSVKAFGSQGQQRTAALALKLSEIQLLKDIRKDTPIVILDDVLSELDETRQKQILSGMGDAQVFITCTGLMTLKNAYKGEMSVYEVTNGVCEKIERTL